MTEQSLPGVDGIDLLKAVRHRLLSTEDGEFLWDDLKSFAELILSDGIKDTSPLRILLQKHIGENTLHTNLNESLGPDGLQGAYYRVPEKVAEGVFTRVEHLSADFGTDKHVRTGEQVNTLSPDRQVFLIPADTIGNKFPAVLETRDFLDPNRVSAGLYTSDSEKRNTVVANLVTMLSTPNLYEGSILAVNITTNGTSRVVVVNSKEPDVILPTDTKDIIDKYISVVGENASHLEALGLPTRRSMLLTGPPGTGKTVTSAMIAHRVIAEGGTVIYPHPESELSRVMAFARKFEKVLVVFEDVESYTGNRGDSQFTEFLNQIDGIADNSRMLILSSTNNPEMLDDAVKREGRVDVTLDFPYFGKEQAAAVFAAKFSSATQVDWDAIAGFLIQRNINLSGAKIAAEVTELVLSYGVDPTHEQVREYFDAKHGSSFNFS